MLDLSLAIVNATPKSNAKIMYKFSLLEAGLKGSFKVRTRSWHRQMLKAKAIFWKSENIVRFELQSSSMDSRRLKLKGKWVKDAYYPNEVQEYR